MPIDFYHMPESPPCRVVELVANKLKVKLNKKHLDLAKGEHLSEKFIAINPRHCVPTIVDGDLILCESRAIISYLVDKYAESDEDKLLYPEDPIQRAKVNMMLYFDMGTLYKAQSEYLGPKLRGRKELDVNMEMKFKEALLYVESVVSKTNYITGDTLSLADISIVCGLTFSEACCYDLSKFKYITLYRERVKMELPSYHEVNTEPIERGLSLLNSSTYWKSLMSDEGKNSYKRPCLDSCTMTTTTSTTNDVEIRHSTNDSETSMGEPQEPLLKKEKASKTGTQEEKFVSPKRNKQVEYLNL